MATGMSMLSGLVVNKIIAVTIGPTGIALISQFQNFISISTSAATAGIQTGVVKYMAEFRDNETEKKEILSSSLRIAILPSLIFGFSIFFLASQLSIYLLGSSDYIYVFRLFGLTITLFSLNVLLMSILNGTGEIKKLVFVKISNSIFSLIVTSLASFFYGLHGALTSLAIAQSIVLIVSVRFVITSDWYKPELFKNKLSRKYLKLLLAYALMALSSMVIAPFVKIELRNYIITNLSAIDAGFWDATVKVSSAYLNVITITLGIYYLPKLSCLKNETDLRKEILNGYKIILPVLFCLLLVVYLMRNYITVLLYSGDFLPMERLYIPQLIGDFFKISSFILSYLMVAKAKVVMYITTEISFSILYYFLSIFLIGKIGLVGIVWANAINYMVYFLIMSIIFRKYLYR